MKKALYLLITLFIFLDSGYSFYQFYHTPIGGDLAEIVIPYEGTGYYDVLQNPLGLGELNYPGTNRFFAHWVTSKYFLHVPLMLQQFVSPVSSIYLSIAIAKLIMQLALVFSLAILINYSVKKSIANLLLTAVFILPLFQTFGYNRYMGIIDQSVVYSFFYALPCIFLLFFLFPFLKSISKNSFLKINTLQFIFSILCIVFISLNGPLIPGVLLIVCPALVLYFFTAIDKNIQFNLTSLNSFLMKYKLHLILLAFACCTSLYSLYIGSFNNQNLSQDKIDLLDRYLRLPNGILSILTKKLGFSLLLLSIIINVIIIKRVDLLQTKAFFNSVKWIFALSVIYLLLLPLGGYREYRANVVRYDTILPITLALVYLFGQSTLLLTTYFYNSRKWYYLIGVAIVLLVFTNADQIKTEHFDCEKSMLEALVKSDEALVVLEDDCTLMEWNIFRKPEQSELNCRLLHHWNVTNSEKRYIQQ